MGDEPHEFSARSGDDDEVHRVDVGTDARTALVDPSPLRTCCGRAVLQLYTDDREVTCPVCTGSAAGS